MEAKPLMCLGLELEIVQVLIHNAITENGPDSFVGIRQAATYALMYYGTARIEEVKELELRQITKKGTSLELQIFKGKRNQTRKLQRCIIHPNALHHQGKMCPVALLDSYLVHHKIWVIVEIPISFSLKSVLNMNELSLHILSQFRPLWFPLLMTTIVIASNGI